MQIGIAFPFFLRYNETQVEAEWQGNGCQVGLGGGCSHTGKNIACNTKGEAICQWV